MSVKELTGNIHTKMKMEFYEFLMCVCFYLYRYIFVCVYIRKKDSLTHPIFYYVSTV